MLSPSRSLSPPFRSLKAAACRFSLVLGLYPLALQGTPGCSLTKLKSEQRNREGKEKQTSRNSIRHVRHNRAWRTWDLDARCLSFPTWRPLSCWLSSTVDPGLWRVAWVPTKTAWPAKTGTPRARAGPPGTRPGHPAPPCWRQGSPVGFTPWAVPRGFVACPLYVNTAPFKLCCRAEASAPNRAEPVPLRGPAPQVRVSASGCLCGPFLR